MKHFQAYQLAKDLYREGLTLALKGELRDQLHRSLLSICLNLAEGTGRRSFADKRRFYTMAFGSLREVQALDDLIDDANLIQKSDTLAACIWRLTHPKPGN